MPADTLSQIRARGHIGIRLGLGRMRALLGHLGDPQEGLHGVLIGGTNGKGSSVAMTGALLQAAGYSVGSYTSPHIVDYNERIAVGGRLASDAEIIAAFEGIEAVRNDVPLTYFEYGTLAAFVVFAAADLDVWLLEVGMGGRLDATNVCEPVATAITTIELEHTDVLGATLEAVAGEKAGILKRDVPCATAARGVALEIVDDAECVQLMTDFIRDNPELWNEDIGV